jgi:hypothetical protein
VTRWLVVLLVLLLSAASLYPLWGVERGAAAAAPLPDDEILAYDVTARTPLTLRLPAGSEDVAITTWAVVPGPRDPDARYPYAFTVTLLDDQGTRLDAQTFEMESRGSRLSLQDQPDVDSARLADGDEPVSDGRTIAFVTPELVRGRVLRIDLRPGVQEHVLIRASYGQGRGELERAAFEKSLGTAARRRLVDRRASLGFLDLRADVRARTLSVWARRMDAIGREGVDYRVRRLLLESDRTSTAVAVAPSPAFEVGPQRAAALNFDRSIDLRVLGPQHRSVRVRDGAGEERLLHLGESGAAQLKLASGGARSVVLDAPDGPDFGLRFSVSASDANAQIGRTARAAAAPSAELAPDVRVLRYAQLAPHDPVIARVAAGQRVLGVYLRAGLSNGAATSTGTMHMQWETPDGHSHRRALQVDLPRSVFERWRSGGDATHAATAMIRLPEGQDRVQLFGDSALCVALWTVHPQALSDELMMPYQVALGPDEEWRYAPHDVRARTPILPANLGALEDAGRVVDLAAQVRIETAAGSGATLPERPLEPEGIPLERLFLESVPFVVGSPWPAGAWTRLDASRPIAVERTGARARRIHVSYHVDEAMLGQAVRLLVDGTEARSQVAVTRAGTIEADVPPGLRQVAVDGLGARGVAYVDAPPARSGPVFRRRAVHRLTREEDLVFRVSQRAGEVLHVVLFVVTERVPERWSIGYTLDGGRPKVLTSDFFRVVTVPSGILSGVGGDAGHGRLWETRVDPAAGEAPHGASKAKIHIGDDLVSGTRVLRLRLLGPQSALWVRAVVVGQAPPAGTVADTRSWLEEGP